MRRYFWVGIVSLGLIAAGCTRLGGRTDQQVAADVQTKINADASFPDKQLNVTSANGVVTLSGTVSSDAARAAAASDAAQVDGVKTVVNNLVVATPDLAGMQADAQTPAPAPQKAPALGAAAIKPSPRSNRASRSYDQASSTQNSNSGDNGLRTTVPQNNGGDSVATSAPAAPAPVPKVTIPVGTQLSIRLTEELSSEKAQVGDVFHGSISAPITVDDQTVVPTTADVEGRVVDVKSAGRFAGKSDLVLQLTKLTMNGKSYSIQTDQWNKDGSSRGKATAAKVGGGAAVGAILGGIFGGGKGAAIGAAAGAGAGTGVSAATKGQQIVLKPEAVINFTLQNPLTVTPGAQRQSMNQ